MAFVNVMRREEPNSSLQKRQQGDNNGNNAGNLPPNNNATLPKNNNGGISKGVIFGLIAAVLVVIILIVIIIRRKMVRDRTRNMEKINDTEWNGGEGGHSTQRLREDYNEQGEEKYSPLMVVRNSPLSSPRFPNSASPRLPYDSFDSQLGPPSPSYSIQNKSSAESLQPLINYSPTNSPHLSPHSPLYPPHSYGGSSQDNQFPHPRGPRSPQFLHFPSSPQRLYRSPPHSPRSLEDPPRSPSYSKDELIQQDNLKKPHPSFPPETNVNISQAFDNNHEVIDKNEENQNLGDITTPKKNESNTVASLSRDINESDKMNVPDTSTLATTETHYAEHNESQSEPENTVLVANPDSPQFMQLPAMEFIKPTQSNMVIERVDNESHNIINNSIPSVDTSKAQPKMVQPSQSNTKTEKVDPKISAPIIIGSSKPEIIAPAPVSSIPVSPLYDIDVIKRHAEKVKNLKATVVAKKVETDSEETENSENVIKENNANKESSNEGGPIKRKKSVRFKADDTNQEEIFEDSNPVASKSNLINKDDDVNLQEPIIRKPTSEPDDDSDSARKSATSSEYQMYDIDLSSYQDNTGVPEILAKLN